MLVTNKLMKKDNDMKIEILLQNERQNPENASSQKARGWLPIPAIFPSQPYTCFFYSPQMFMNVI